MTRMMMLVCAACLVGCQNAPPLFECDLSYPDGENSPPTVTCPRQTPVVLEDTLSPDTNCVYEPEAHVILCDDESRFDAMTGQRVVDGEEERDGGISTEGLLDMGGVPDNERLGMSPSASQPGGPSRLWASSPCTPLSGQLVCTNGSIVTLPSGDDPMPDTCQARMLMGFGVRVVCSNPDGALVSYVPDHKEDTPDCATRQGIVQCEDGSTFELEAYQTAEGEQLEACTNPRLAPPAPPEVVARCMDELVCDVPEDDLLECYTTLVPSQACEEAMRPQLLCGNEPIQPEVRGTYCHAPGGVYWLSSADAVPVLQEKNCTHIIGDVVLAPPREEWEEQGTNAERVDIRWIDAISGVQSIHGGLSIVHTDLPLNRTFEYDAILADLGLAIISYDFVWEDQIGIKDLLIPKDLVHVGGQFRLADFKAVESLIFQKQIRKTPRFVGKDLAIQANAFLTEMTLEEAEVGGSLVLAENTRLEGCELQEAIKWAYDHAGGLVLIHALNGLSKPPRNCLF